LTAQAVFLLERGHTHAHTVTDASGITKATIQQEHKDTIIQNKHQKVKAGLITYITTSGV